MFINRCVSWFYGLFVRLGDWFSSYFLLVIRLFWGILFCLAGYGKLTHIEQITQFFDSLALPYASYNAYLVAWCEFIGGLCLAIGFGARIFTIPLIIIMLTAYATAHREAVIVIFENPDIFVREAPFPFLFATLTVFCFGPGKFSLDRKLLGPEKKL